MPKPLPWSPSALDTFVNCPSQYHHKYVLKDLPEEVRTEQQIHGEDVHKHFEDRQCVGKPLPDFLAEHEPFMVWLENLPGSSVTEQKIALTHDLLPVSWAWRKDEIWYRGIIDYIKLCKEKQKAWIVDYKTGRPHQKFRQLVSYVLYAFILYPYIDTINARFYWTKDGTSTYKVYRRDEMDLLWAELVGDLQQYAKAFKTNTWQERPSGLCKRHCPVLGCKHNGRRKGGPHEFDPR